MTPSCLSVRGTGGWQRGLRSRRGRRAGGEQLSIDLAQINSSGNPLIRTSTHPTEGNHSVEGGDAALGRYGRQTRRRRQRQRR